MRFTQLFTKTQKEAPRDEESKNAKLLLRAGFIHKEMAGVYSFLPLGWRTLSKIENIVRDEMNTAGAQEMFMPALHPKANWIRSGRWESFDALFKVKSRYENEYALGPTHEEILYPLLTRFISSYKDLPVAMYQIQTKFRDEPRAKSGLLRGREFRMKDLYSFHTDISDRDAYYEEIRKAYLRIFERIGLDVIETQATGGTFSDLSLEFQVACDAGEDTILVCSKCKFGTNEELANEQKCPRCGGSVEKTLAVEAGNIFPLKDKYSEDFQLTYRDAKGAEKLVSAGCYGLGTSRVMGTIAEVFSDEKGLIWPIHVAPYHVHLIALAGQEKGGDALYEKLEKSGLEVLYDDRGEVGAGEKFADADLIGLPWRVVMSEKTLAQKSAELKKRTENETRLIPVDKLADEIL